MKREAKWVAFSLVVKGPVKKPTRHVCGLDSGVGWAELASKAH